MGSPPGGVRIVPRLCPGEGSCFNVLVSARVPLCTRGTTCSKLNEAEDPARVTRHF